MLYKKHHPVVGIISFLLFSFFTLQSTAEGFNFTVKGITPLILLPLLTSYAIFSSIKRSAIIGFVIGACLDSVASRSFCFNTIIFMLIGAFACLTANYLFNKNIRAATVLSLLIASIYFFLHWLVFHAFIGTSQQSLEFLLGYSLPAALYTSVFIFPFYFLYKHFNSLE